MASPRRSEAGPGVTPTASSADGAPMADIKPPTDSNGFRGACPQSSNRFPTVAARITPQPLCRGECPTDTRRPPGSRREGPFEDGLANKPTVSALPARGNHFKVGDTCCPQASNGPREMNGEDMVEVSLRLRASQVKRKAALRKHAAAASIGRDVVGDHAWGLFTRRLSTKSLRCTATLAPASNLERGNSQGKRMTTADGTLVGSQNPNRRLERPHRGPSIATPSLACI